MNPDDLARLLPWYIEQLRAHPEPWQVVDLADDIMYAADRRDRHLWLTARVLAAVAAMIEDERPEEEEP